MNYNYDSRPAYTVTPNITQDEITGEQTLHIHQAEVRSSQGREEANMNNVREQAEGMDFYLDDEGNYQFGLEASDAEIDMLVEDMGGQEAYDNALFWAMNTLSDSDIAEFDAVMENGDLTEVADMMGQLQNLYTNRSHDIDAWDDAENYVYNEVCTPEMYRNVKEFVSNNYNDGDINEFNKLVNSNDLDDIDYAIRTVIAAMNGDEYEEDEDWEDEN